MRGLCPARGIEANTPAKLRSVAQLTAMVVSVSSVEVCRPTGSQAFRHRQADADTAATTAETSA